MLIIAFMAVMTWVIPAGQYQVDEAGRLVAGTYEKVAQNPQGILRCFYGSSSCHAWSRCD